MNYESQDLPNIDLIEALRNQPDSKLIEPRFKESIDNYVEYKQQPGHFITAVLENDLVGAFSRADYEAMANLKHIICYCYNEIPGDCWGSKEKVKSWFNTERPVVNILHGGSDVEEIIIEN